jgi:hypothetical protein
MLPVGSVDPVRDVTAAGRDWRTREPQAAELKRWAAAVRSFATTGEIMHDQAAWAQLAHTLFNTQEFIYYR